MSLNPGIPIGTYLSRKKYPFSESGSLVIGGEDVCFFLLSCCWWWWRKYYLVGTGGRNLFNHACWANLRGCGRGVNWRRPFFGVLLLRMQGSAFHGLSSINAAWRCLRNLDKMWILNKVISQKFLKNLAGTPRKFRNKIRSPLTGRKLLTEFRIKLWGWRDARNFHHLAPNLLIENGWGKKAFGCRKNMSEIYFAFFVDEMRKRYLRVRIKYSLKRKSWFTTLSFWEKILTLVDTWKCDPKVQNPIPAIILVRRFWQHGEGVSFLTGPFFSFFFFSFQ